LKQKPSFNLFSLHKLIIKIIKVGIEINYLNYFVFTLVLVKFIQVHFSFSMEQLQFQIDRGSYQVESILRQRISALRFFE